MCAWARSLCSSGHTDRAGDGMMYRTEHAKCKAAPDAANTERGERGAEAEACRLQPFEPASRRSSGGASMWTTPMHARTCGRIHLHHRALVGALHGDADHLHAQRVAVGVRGRGTGAAELRLTSCSTPAGRSKHAASMLGYTKRAKPPPPKEGRKDPPQLSLVAHAARRQGSTGQVWHGLVLGATTLQVPSL